MTETALAAASTEDRTAQLEHRVGELERRLAFVEDHLQAAGHVASWAAEQLTAMDPRLDTLESVAQQMVQLVSWDHDELQRLGAHLSGLEQRVEGGSRQSSVDATSAAAVAATLLAEARAEHERLRARTALVSSYEERLRRLEQA